MSEQTTYRVNDQKVINETLDGETIIINLENGNYYSMNPSGSVVWELIVKNSSKDQIISEFLQRYETTKEDLEKPITDLLQLLVNEDLIVKTDLPAVHTEPSSAPTEKESFLVPLIEKYEDMQEMLLADPIHDVDAIGWPKLK